MNERWEAENDGKPFLFWDSYRILEALFQTEDCGQSKAAVPPAHLDASSNAGSLQSDTASVFDRGQLVGTKKRKVLDHMEGIKTQLRDANQNEVSGVDNKHRN